MSSRASIESLSLFILPFVLLSLLPIGLTWWLADHALSGAQEAAIQSLIEEARLELCRLLSSADPGEYTTVRLRKLQKSIFRARPDPEKLRSLLPQMTDRLGFSPDLFLFDGKGNPVLSETRLPDIKPAISALWDALTDRQPFSGEYLEHNDVLRALFGDGLSPLLLKVQRNKGGTFTPRLQSRVGKETQKSLLLWDVDPFTRYGGILLLVWDLPETVTLLKAMLPHSPLASSSLLIVNRTTKGGNLLGKPIAESFLKTLLGDYTLNERSWQVIDDRLWIALSGTEYLYYLDFPFSLVSHEPQRRGLKVLALLLLFMSWPLFSRFVRRTRQGNLTIRGALFFMLLFAFLTLLFAGAVFGRRFLDSSTTLAERTIREKSEEIANRSSNSNLVVRDARQQTQTLFQKFLQKLGKCRTRDEFFKRLETGRDRRLFTEVRLFDQAGQPVPLPFGQGLQSRAAAEADLFWMSLANQVLREHALGAFPRGTMPAVASMVASFPTFQIDRPGDLRALAQRPGLLSLLAVNGADQLFWDFVDMPWGKGGILFFRNSLANSLEQYCQRVFGARETLDAHAFRFLFCMNDLTVRYPLESPWPRRFERLHEMSKRMGKMSGRPLFTKISWDRQPCYIVALSSILYDNSTLFIMYPQAPVQEFRELVKYRLILGFLLAIPFLFLVSWYLAGLLEVPLGRLEILRNMQHRLSGFDLVGMSAAKGGSVTAAFDSIIENLDEINTARSIQEQLFPLEVLSLGPYHAFGISKPARDLGGDYFDYHVVNRDQMLVVIGDVTGHGIPAALVVSMAKAVVTDCARNGASPGDLLHRLDQTLQDAVKKKRFMTMGLLWIDTATHEASYYNCGHPYPLLVRADGTTTYVAGKGNFLGRVSRAPRIPVSLTLAPGDRFVFYTDGLAESFHPDKNIDAYESLREYVAAKGQGRPLRETCRILLAEHPHFSSGNPQPDDFTLVIVEHRP